jgi:hypothetical protein
VFAQVQPDSGVVNYTVLTTMLYIHLPEHSPFFLSMLPLSSDAEVGGFAGPTAYYFAVNDLCTMFAC